MKGRGDFAADRRLILLSGIAAVIGAVCAFVAILLLGMIAFFTNLFYYHQFSLIPHSPTYSVWGWGAIAVPVVGGLIIGLMARYGSEKIRGHGIPEALEAILFGKSLMQPKVAILKPLSSAISIGSGGPFGAEGPIIMTGGAFGSIFAQLFHLTASERKTLLVAGAAAGMSAVFASPIAAILLAVELLLFEWRPRSLVPVAIASLMAGAVRPYFLGGGPLFPIPAHVAIGTLELVSAIFVGLAAGAFSTLVSRSLYKLEDWFQLLPVHWMWWPALGGLVVGIGGVFEPRVLGVGYDVIADLLSGRITVKATTILIAIKSLVWIVALASGTSGGVLAPLLIMGAGLGVAESTFLPGSPIIWPLISMAAVLGGMMRAPLTAVVFALELTHDLNALPALMIASIAAYAFTVLAMKRSILTEKVARRGYDIFREYGVDPLERVRAEEVMSAHIGDHPSHMNSYETIFPDESCRIAAERMAKANIKEITVVSRENIRKTLGTVALTDLLKPRLISHKEENEFETHIRFPRW
jgi:H+/Cl- antiporter ClcA